MLSFFDRVYAAAADLQAINKDYGVHIDKWISSVFVMELPKEFRDTQKNFSDMKDIYGYGTCGLNFMVILLIPRKMMMVSNQHREWLLHPGC